MAKLYRLIEYDYDEHNRSDLERTLARSLGDSVHYLGGLSIRIRTIKPVADVYSVVVTHSDKFDQEQITDETFIPETALGTFAPCQFEVARSRLEQFRSRPEDIRRADLVRMLVYLCPEEPPKPELAEFPEFPRQVDLRHR